jgi:RNA 2',3'-cyclic 3'-phosphodiesterase
MTLEPRVQQYLKDIQTKWNTHKLGKISLVKPEHMHLSLAFLGEPDELLLNDVTYPFNKLVNLFSPINVSLSETGMFPHANDPKIIWMGINGELDKLYDFKKLVDGVLEKLEFETDKRKFQAHITLGRVKYLKQPSHQLAHSVMETDVFPLQFKLSELVWIESTLTQQGPVYKTLKTFPLIGEDSHDAE